MLLSPAATAVDAKPRTTPATTKSGASVSTASAPSLRSRFVRTRPEPIAIARGRTMGSTARRSRAAQSCSSAGNRVHVDATVQVGMLVRTGRAGSDGRAEEAVHRATWNDRGSRRALGVLSLRRDNDRPSAVVPIVGAVP